MCPCPHFIKISKLKSIFKARLPIKIYTPWKNLSNLTFRKKLSTMLDNTCMDNMNLTNLTYLYLKVTSCDYHPIFILSIPANTL